MSRPDRTSVDDYTSHGPAPQGCPHREGRLVLSNEDMRDGPATLYHRMREQYGPVVPIDLDPQGTENGTPAWLVIGYSELLEVCSDEDRFSRDSRHWRELREGRLPADWWLRPHVAHRDNTRFADTPYHQPRRDALIRALKSVDQTHVVRLVTTYADQLIDRFCALGETEVIAEYARPLPLLVTARLFGLRSPGDQANLLDAIHRMLTGGKQAQRADHEITKVLQNLVEDRRLTPQDDLASRLIAAAPGQDDQAIREELWLLLHAGAGATTYWIANAFQQLATDHGLRTGLNNGSHTLDAVLRATLWNAPPAENVMGAFARRDTVLGGRQIQTGDMLVLGLGGANHDPILGTARASYTTSNDSHLAFGAGVHRCPAPGQILGELITSVAVERLWQRCPNMSLAEPGTPLSWGPSFVMRALTALPVVFDASEPGSRRAPDLSAFGGPEWSSPQSSDSPTEYPPRTSSNSPGPSTDSIPSGATSRRKDRPSRRSDRSSLWSSLIAWWRGQ
ncbi:cytochrome P450 [Streptomyces piniterrae]|uniref:cytochrome P450 n=1 Tax=Streptomyces piniterrae TaxID=2571125 RepID=UPI00145C5496|nr:cytochrome P450 [Streptomyces piniterrae]